MSLPDRNELIERCIDAPEDAGPELYEAYVEIERHHDLIVKLRDGLSWALDYIDDAVVGMCDDATFERQEELRLLLNREVG